MILMRDQGLKLEYVPFKDDVLAIADVESGALDVAFAGLTSARAKVAALKRCRVSSFNGRWIETTSDRRRSSSKDTRGG